jgi:quercetin dioxygenase-like cupin family protein
MKRTNYAISLNNKMKKKNFVTIKSDKQLLAEKQNYFLGKVILHDISKDIDIKGQKVYYAGFRNGARTKVHYHESGQILVVTKGKGMLVLYRKSGPKYNKTGIRPVTRSSLQAGDIVYIPKKILHWHGALARNDFVHIAFNLFTSGGKEAKTVWYDSDFVSYATRIP